MTITKSLHTVTATMQVAKLLLAVSKVTHYQKASGAVELAADALGALGYPEVSERLKRNADAQIRADVTLGRIVKVCETLVAEQLRHSQMRERA